MIYLENHSFDNLYGLFPGADGLDQAGAVRPQVDQNGRAYPLLPAVASTLLNPPVTGFSGLPNKPFDLGPLVPLDKPTPVRSDLPLHRFYQEQTAIDGGKMDRFAAVGASVAMGHYDGRSLPMWKYAEQYVLADHYSHAAFGGTGLNHFWLVCACTPQWPDAPPNLVARLGSDGTLLQDGVVSPDGFVVNNQSYPADTKDLSCTLNQVKATGADLLIGSGHLDDSLVMMKQVKSLGLNFKGIGLSVGPSTPEFSAALGKDGDYVFSGVQWVPEQKSTGAIIGSAQDYIQAFQKKYNIIPEYHSADGAAAGLALQLAIEKAGSLDREKVRDALASLDVDTFYGHLKFDSRGANADKPMVVIQLQDGGKNINVWPLPATGKILWPTPAWDKR